MEEKKWTDEELSTYVFVAMKTGLKAGLRLRDQFPNKVFDDDFLSTLAIEIMKNEMDAEDDEENTTPVMKGG